MSTSGERRRVLLLVAACLAAAPLAAGLALAMGHDVRRAEAAGPPFARDADYVGAGACRACHPDHHASWRRTYHASMTERRAVGARGGAPVVRGPEVAHAIGGDRLLRPQRDAETRRRDPLPARAAARGGARFDGVKYVLRTDVMYASRSG